MPTSAREQWAGGANSFAIRLEVILFYARKAATALDQEGRG